MASSQSRQQYAGAMATQVTGLSSYSENCEIIIRQEPNCARVSLGKDKERKPVDPPPIIQLKVSPNVDPKQSFLQSPYIFMSCSLIGPNDHNQPPGTLGASLTGTVVSSLHRLKDTDNQDGGFFVWGDLSVKLEGHFRFRFILFEIFEDHVWYIKDIVSKPFPIYSSKNFPGNPETTFLTRSFGDQGIKVRVRKEQNRTLIRKRGMAHDDYDNQHYGPRKMNASQIRAKQNTRDSQEMVRNLECQQDSGESTYDTRTQIDRHFSSQSPPSFGCPVSYDEPSKRPRTTSDTAHIPTYIQPSQPMSYQSRPFAESTQANFLPYGSQSHQNGTFSYTCEPSVFSHASASRNQYFAPHIDTGEPPSPYELQAQRSPTNAYFPNHQTNYAGSIISNLPRIDSNHNSYDSLGINSRGQASPTSIPSMADLTPSMYARMSTGVAYSNVSLSPPDRRDAYQAYSVPSAFPNEAGSFLSRHPGITAIEGAGPLEGAY